MSLFSQFGRLALGHVYKIGRIIACQENMSRGWAMVWDSGLDNAQSGAMVTFVSAETFGNAMLRCKKGIIILDDCRRDYMRRKMKLLALLPICAPGLGITQENRETIRIELSQYPKFWLLVDPRNYAFQLKQRTSLEVLLK